jgi:hypothetical protein
MMKKGTDIVLEVHYHPNGKAAADQTSIGIHYAKKPASKYLDAVFLGNMDIDIPAGEKHYVRKGGVTLSSPVTVIGIVPHMHLLGREWKVTAKQPSGEVTPLIWVNNWDFRWQDQYQYRKPFELPAGTDIRFKAVYDNSAENPANPSNPPRRVRYGEGTTDEMCFLWVLIARDIDNKPYVEPDESIVPGKRRLGVSLDPECVITKVWKGERAEGAGLKEGDRILEFGGKKVADEEALVKAIREAQGEVEIRILRGGIEQTCKTTFPVDRSD